MNNNEIISICQKYKIQNYTINQDGSVSVDGNVDILNRKLSRLPLKFRNVSGYFRCSENKLKSLEGCPSSVGRDFNCSHNQLESLEGCPNSVGGGFYCSYISKYSSILEKISDGVFLLNLKSFRRDLVLEKILQ